MKTVLFLTFKNLLCRKYTFSLSVITVMISIVLIFGIERFRSAARDSFFNTVSGVDLIVGARSDAVNLLLYSVFHIGRPVGNISFKTFDKIKSLPEVDAAIPISLGDSHRSFKVMGTDHSFFEFYRFANDQKITFLTGGEFNGIYDVVLGSEVSNSLKYELHDKIKIMHGLSEFGLFEHEEHPFQVVGILKPTGTNIDRLIITSLEGLEAIHENWQDGVPSHEEPDEEHEHEHEHAESEHSMSKSISALMLKLSAKNRLFAVQEQINEYQGEPLTAAIPGLTLAELWQIVGNIENAFILMSVLVFIAGLIGMINTILASMNERQKELAILRSLGAGPGFISGLIVCESFLTVVSATFFAVVVLMGIQYILNMFLVALVGFTVPLTFMSMIELRYTAVIVVLAIAASVIPAVKAYRISLQHAMSFKT